MPDPTEPPDDSDRGNDGGPLTIHDLIGDVGINAMKDVIRETALTTLVAHIKHECQVDVDADGDPVDRAQAQHLSMDIAANVANSLAGWPLPDIEATSYAAPDSLAGKCARVCDIVCDETTDNIRRIFAAAQVLLDARDPEPVRRHRHRDHATIIPARETTIGRSERRRRKGSRGTISSRIRSATGSRSPKTTSCVMSARSRSASNASPARRHRLTSVA